MNRTTFQDLASCLTADQTPRVWSLLVTVFGELAQDEGAKISGTLLGSLTTLMGIKPEAMRVALHRLRKDGWIESERDGRKRIHQLTQWGRAQSAKATPRIYCLADVTAPAFLVICDPTTNETAATHPEAWITSNIVITTQPDLYSDAFSTRLQPGDLPEWMRHKAINRATQNQANALLDQMSAMHPTTDALSNDGLSKLEIAALRILIVHGWRRIALRTPALPDFVFPDQWVGPACRTYVATFLSQLPAQNLCDLKT